MPQSSRSRSQRLSEGQIVKWAKAHFKRFGRYPSGLAGDVIGADGEKWGNINSALIRGDRGLRGGESLAVFLRRTVGKTRRMYKPVLSENQIITWACRHFSRERRWPFVASGAVIGERGERWNAIDMALRYGVRGLPGGSSLRQLLSQVVGPSIKLKKPPYTTQEIVEWAKEHKKRTGLWPIPRSGPIHGAPGESWYAVQAALQLGQRGLSGGDSLSRVLQRYVGKKPGKQLPRLPQSQILEWADAYHRKHHRWPQAESGVVEGGDGLTWLVIESSLRNGSRGLRGGQSLAKLLLAARGESAATERPKPELSQILSWADAFHRRTGRWPTRFVLKDHRMRWGWAAINDALVEGRVRGVRAGTKLPDLLTERRGAAFTHPSRTPLSIEQILIWADRHRSRTRCWPSSIGDEAVGAPDGLTWRAINSALVEGGHGLPKGGSLARLLMVKRGARHSRYLAPLTIGKILAWADAFHQRTGRWPRVRSGSIPGTTETWNTVGYALKYGTRGMSGQHTLAGLLVRKRGLRRTGHMPKLTVPQILAWATAHHRRTGRWPIDSDGVVCSATGETWSGIRSALRYGHRGLKKGPSLTRLLDTIRGDTADPARKRQLELREVLLWAKAHCRRTGSWPDRYDGRVIDAKGETWFGIDEALRRGLRGLPKVRSLGILFSGLPKPRSSAGRRH